MTPQFDQDRRRRLRRLYENTTPAIWQARHRRTVCAGATPIVHTRYREDMEFIAVAHREVPDLLDALEAAEKRVAELEEHLGHLEGCVGHLEGYVGHQGQAGGER